MKATKAPQRERLAEPPLYREQIPEPPGDDVDTSKWRLVGRGNGAPKGAPLIGLELHFDREQSEWIRAEAKRTGLDYFEVVKKLVDEARKSDGAA